jgi:signal transduction histidine kinase
VIHRLRLGTQDWALGLAPQELAGQREGVVFMVICLVALGLVTTADLVAPRHASVSVIALLPVGAAAWLLSRTPAVVVVVVAMALQAVVVVFGAVPFLTAMTQFLMIPVLAYMARVAATGTIRAREQEVDAREARAGEEKARELERAKSEFLRLASHELRGPVAILRGYVAMIEDGSLGEVPSGIGRVLPVLSATAGEMNLMVEQMLDTARLEDSRLQLKRRETDLVGLVRQAANSVHVMNDRSHELRLRGCDGPLPVVCDPARITTVVNNLVSNAMKYSPPGTDVTVLVERGDGQAKVAVADNGIGISENDLDRLFVRFGRIDTPETAHIHGTGLGLYLSREVARLHGGDITVTSRPAEGSTFTLVLPAPERRPTRSPQDSRLPRPARRQSAG